MHYYQFNIADYRKDTVHLTPIEHFIYRSLLDTYYLTEEPISLDIRSVMRTHCLRTANDEQSLINVLNDFFIKSENGYIHKRVEQQLQEYKKKSEKAAQSANARWAKNKEKDANALHPQSESNTDGMLTNNHKPITNNHKPFIKNITHISDEILRDYMEIRKAKRAGKLTQTAFNAIEREAANAGITTEQALQVCIERGWVGFKAEWLARDIKVKGHVNKRAALEESNRKVAENWLPPELRGENYASK